MPKPLNRIPRLTLFSVLCVTWFNVTAGKPVETPGGAKKTVLVLYGDRLSIPAMKTTEQGLMAGLSRAQPQEVEIFTECLDLSRSPAAQYGDDLVRYLRARYAARKPDVVIAILSSALELALAHREELFPGVPIVFANVDYREVEGRAMPPEVTGLCLGWDYQRTVELALQLQPEIREVVCVAGTGPQEQRWNNEARKVFERFATRVRTRWLDKLPLPAALKEVAQLPRDSVVLYIPMLLDGAGKSVSPFEVARQVAQASKVPVYGLSEPQLEQGIIGGALLDFSEIGNKTAALALRVLAGERPPVLAPPDPAINPLFINWRSFEKWQLPERRIPKEATVRYRDRAIWEQHPRLSLATAAVVGLQSFLIVGLIVQRSKLKRAERSLRDSEERMNLAAEAANLGMWVWDVVRDKIWMSDKERALFGLATDTTPDNAELIARVHPEDRAARAAALKHAVETHGEYAMEYRLLLPDGTLRWIDARGHCMNNKETEGVRLHGVSIDVTVRRMAQERFRLVVEASPHGIVLANTEGHIVLVNASAEKLFGYEREELIGQGIELLVPERFRAEHPGHRERFHGAPAARAMGAGLELFARRKDGSEFPVEIGISPIQSAEGMLVLSAIVDISPRKQAEADARQHLEELTHLSRVAMMGEMAGSLAHELNQPLTGIVNNASAGRRFIAKGRADLPKLDGLLGAVVADGLRAGEIIRSIRGMVGKGERVRGPANLNEVIASVLGIVRSDALRRQCAMVAEPDPNLPLVEADQVQLQQVLINFIVNAFEAMRETPVSERRVIIRSERESDTRVRVSVRDFGIGMPTEDPARIFEQFFSTKRDGLGLGLAIARTIVTSHGGEVAAANVKGGGACVYFSLPVIAEVHRSWRGSVRSEGGRKA